MKIAITGDGHCDERSRFDEWKRVHDWMADDWRKRGVKLALNSGDLYERRSTPTERMAMAAWIRKVGEFAEHIIVKGNHCAAEDLLLLEKLDTKERVRVLERPECFERLIFTKHAPAETVLIAALPWPQKAGVLKHAAELGLGSEGAELMVHEALQHILRGMGAMMDKADPERKRPRILLAHAMVEGAKTSTGQPLCGMPMSVGADDLRLAMCDAYALGHVHLPSSFGDDMFYTGSPRRTAFGEVERKSYVLYETDTKTWERIEIPCTPMLLVDAVWHLDRLDWAMVGASSFEGAEVRLRFTCPADQREAAVAAAERLKAEWLEAGAVDVKLDPVTTTVTTAKAPEVAAADTTAGKLRALWTHRAEDIPPERADRLLGKLAEIEQELG